MPVLLRGMVRYVYVIQRSGENPISGVARCHAPSRYQAPWDADAPLPQAHETMVALARAMLTMAFAM